MSNEQFSNEDNGLLAEKLATEPETTPRVSGRLHQDIMRAVKLSQPEPRPSLFRHMPMWATAMAATAALVIYMTQPPESEFVPQQVSIPAAPDTSSGQTMFAALEARLTAIPSDPAIAEQQLRAELERLKSDLKKFGLGT